MDINILDTPEVRSFIHQHQDDEVGELILKSDRWPDLPIKSIAQQIQSRKKAKKKLPSWYANDKVIFPPSDLLEQASSEATARFKSSIIGGKHLLDLTGGTAVDSFYLSGNFEKVTIVEPNPELIELAQHNFGVFGLPNVVFVNSKAEDFLNETDEQFDVVYIDPSRRKEGQRLMLIEDCLPNVIEIWDNLLQRSNSVFLKLSPLLDIHQSVDQLRGIERTWVIASRNECKELLFEAGGSPDAMEVSAVNILKEKSEAFSFKVEEETNAQPTYGDPNNFLYEPNVAILKSGAFKLISERFGLAKLEANTHLYTSVELMPGFLGRVFKIDRWAKFDWKSLKKMRSHKFNIVARNFPHSVSQIRQRSGILEGGEDFVFFTRLRQNQLVQINCRRVQE